MARSYFNIASFNLRNLVNPEVTYYGRSKYSVKRYNEKLTWLAEQLYRMDADIVCLQEVFHLEALEDLLARYDALLATRQSAHKARLDKYDNVRFEPNIKERPGNPQPGLALLSRRKILAYEPIQDISDNPVEVPEDDGFAYSLTQLSRPLQIAKIDLGKGVAGWVYNAHLKSKLPRFPAGDPAANEENALFYDRTAGVFRALALRAGEALALRREILVRAYDTNTPQIVVGDLNDEIGAVSTEMVVGEAPWRRLPRDVKVKYWDVELYSVVRTHLRRSEDASIYTHVHNGAYATIDHILVSQEFYYRNKDRIGDVHFVRVHNDHLTDDSLDGAPGIGPASDHGQLVARISIDPERLPVA